MTFDANQDEETIKNSILPRLLIVMTKNILPVKVLILGIGETNRDFCQKIQSNVNKALRNLEKKLRKSVDLQIKYFFLIFIKKNYLRKNFIFRNFLNLNFNLQLELSDILNLAEHISYLINLLDYGGINLENNSDKMFLLNSSNLIKDTPSDSEFYKIDAYNIIDNITNADLAELKSIKAPPSGVQIVGEAMCYLFAKPATYQNFVRLINSPNFIYQLKEFDINSVSEYKLNHIKQYVDMPNFSPEYISKISKTASILCQFVRSVYFYCSSTLPVN